MAAPKEPAPRRRRVRRARREPGTGSVFADGHTWRAEIRVRVAGESQVLRKRGSDPDALEAWLDALVASGKDFATHDALTAWKQQYANAGVSSGTTGARTVTLNDFARDWIEHRRPAVSPKTTDAYTNTLNRYIAPTIGEVELGSLTRDHLRAFTRYMATAEPVTTYETQHLQWRNLRALLLAARRAHLLNSDLSIHHEDAPVRPRSDVPTSPRDRSLSDEHMGAVVATLRREAWACTPENHAQDRCGVEWQLAITYGIRQGERVAVQQGDVEIHNVDEGDPGEPYGYLTLQRHAERRRWEHGCKGGDSAPSCGRRFGSDCPKRKGGGMFSAPGLKSRRDEHGKRELWLDPTLTRLMDTHLRALRRAGQASATNLLFGYRGDGSTIRQPEQDTRAWRALQAEAGVSRTNGTPYAVHDLRHTAATTLANQADINTAQAVLGHSDLRTTMRYVHTTPDRTAPGIERAMKFVGIMADDASDRYEYRNDPEVQEQMTRMGDALLSATTDEERAAVWAEFGFIDPDDADA